LFFELQTSLGYWLEFYGDVVLYDGAAQGTFVQKFFNAPLDRRHQKEGHGRQLCGGHLASFTFNSEPTPFCEMKLVYHKADPMEISMFAHTSGKNVTKLEKIPVCFVQIPKTATEFICSVLGLSKNHMHAASRDLSECWSFAVVRNPLERMLSFYAFCRTGYKGGKVFQAIPSPTRACKLAHELDSDTWIQRVLADSAIGMLDHTPGVNAFESASAWVTRQNGTEDAVDYLVNFDDVGDFAVGISKVMGSKQALNVKVKKNPSNYSDISFELSQKTSALIQAHFSWEINRFSFRPPEALAREI